MYMYILSRDVVVGVQECRQKEQEESRLPQKYLFNPKIQAGRQGNTG